MKWIGLTGGIATGKSTVRKIITDNNIPVIDADQISHEITQTGLAGYIGIVSHFGASILNPDQSLNRKMLGEIVFKDQVQLLKLESILHPLIQQKVEELKQHYKNAGETVCFYDVPLLFEKKLQSQFDQVVLVYAPLSQQITRVMKRNNLSHLEAITRINSQVLMCEKICNADFCIDNSTNIEDLKQQIIVLLKHLVSL